MSINIFGYYIPSFSHVRTIQFYYLGTEFYLGEDGSDCPLLEIVDQLEECKAAAAQLGHEYKDTSSGRYFPNGCFSWSGGFYFNTQHSSIQKTPSSGRRGVCIQSMLYIFDVHCLGI